MSDRITTFLSEADALACGLLDDLPPVAPETSRRFVGGVDPVSATVDAVAVVDVDATGSAWVRCSAGVREGLDGLADLLRASGARRLLAGDPPRLVEL